MTFGTRLKELRNEKGLTQQQLADILKVGRPTIAGYETKDRQPDYEKLSMICQYFNVSSDYLLGRTKEKDQILITPETLMSEKEVDEILSEETKKLLMNMPIRDGVNEYNIEDILIKEANNYKLKSQIYNDLYEKVLYDKSSKTLNIYPKHFLENVYNNDEIALLIKFRLLDEMGKHTVRTILEMEYSRCNANN
jgi:transcriptional regulator with XRE-family HTH domain